MERDGFFMALVTTKEMFRIAYEGGFAIGAFNVNKMEIIQAITEAANEEITSNTSGFRWREKIRQA